MGSMSTSLYHPRYLSATIPVLTWIGRILSAVVVMALAIDGLVMSVWPHLLQKEMEATGFPSSQLMPLGMLTLTFTAFYAFPKTAPLGAILVTAFLGGAVCLHFRLGSFFSAPQLICISLGLMTWAGLYLRDSRVRALLPIRVARDGGLSNDKLRRLKSLQATSGRASS